MEQQKQKRRSIYKHINLNPEYSEYRNLTSEINEADSKAEHIGQILQAYNKCKCSCHKITLVLPLSISPRGCEQGTLTCLWISVWRHSSWRNEQTQSLLITPCQSLSLPQLPKAHLNSVLIHSSQAKQHKDAARVGRRLQRSPSASDGVMLWRTDRDGTGDAGSQEGLESLFQEGKTK